MDPRKIAPAILYDDRCYLCTKFAGIVNALAGRKFFLIGHYSELGEKLGGLLGPDARRMFWFIDGEVAHGGRAALLPLLAASFSGKASRPGIKSEPASCATGCKNPKAVFVRSASLLTNSRRIHLDRS